MLNNLKSARAAKKERQLRHHQQTTKARQSKLPVKGQESESDSDESNSTSDGNINQSVDEKPHYSTAKCGLQQIQMIKMRKQLQTQQRQIAALQKSNKRLRSKLANKQTSHTIIDSIDNLTSFLINETANATIRCVMLQF